MSQPSRTAIQTHIARILASRAFLRAPMAQRFVEIASVSALLEQPGGPVTEGLIGTTLYGATFRAGEDNRVRQLARTVRRKVDEFYRREGVSEHLRLTFKRGSYEPVIESDSSVAGERRRPPASTTTETPRAFDLDACREYILRQPADVQRALTRSIRKLEALDGPAGAHTPYLASVLRINAANVLLLPSGYSNPDSEGIGRTSLLMRVLGISFSYESLMAVEGGALPDEIVPQVSSTRTCSLIASDEAHVDVRQGQLVAWPAPAEGLRFIWDLARHIFRLTTPDYQTGGHRLPGIERRRLFDIFFRIPFQSVQPLFERPSPSYDSPVAVNHIVVVRQDFPSQEQPSIPTEISFDNSTSELRAALSVGAFHPATKWSNRTPAIIEQVDHLISQIAPPDAIPIPPMHEVLIARPYRLYSRHTFDHVAKTILELFSSHRPAEERLHADLQRMNAFRGIRRHNDILINAICDATRPLSLELLLTSGQKLFSDVAFWHALLDACVPIKLLVLFLDPESVAATRRASVSYHDKKQDDFFDREIRTNVATFERLVGYLQTRGAPITAAYGYYTQPPNFKLTFIGEGQVLAATYSRQERTGSSTLFFNLRAREPGDFYSGLRQEFARLLHSAKLKTEGQVHESE